MITFSLYSSAGYTPSILPNGTVEALVGETLEVRIPVGTISSVTASVNPGSGASVNAVTITFSAAGRYRFTVATSLGAADFSVLCCESTCPSKLPATKSAGEKRAILRSLARHAEWFTGLASEIPPRNLTPYGG